MIDTYKLMYKDVYIGDLSFNTDNRRFKFIVNHLADKSNLPIGIYPIDKLDVNYIPTHEDIKEWVEDRVMPPERQCLQDILKSIGLLYYDAWDICRKTRGMCIEDSYWLSKGNEKYEDTHFKPLMLAGKPDKIPFESIIYEPEVKFK